MVTYGDLAAAVTRNYRLGGMRRLTGTRFPIDYLLWHLEKGATPETFVAEHPAVTLAHARSLAAVWLEAASTADRRAARERVRQHVRLALLREAVGEMIAAGEVELPDPPAAVRSREPSPAGDRLGTDCCDAGADAWIRRCVTALRAVGRPSPHPERSIQAQKLAHRLEDLLGPKLSGFVGA